MIKYSWAVFKGKTVHISEVTSEMRKDDKFFNTVTGERMTAYLNGKFQKHFHHLDQNLTPHSHESYLHETAKKVFAETYNECLISGKPFNLKYWQVEQCKQNYKSTGIVCDLGESLRTFDLTKTFTEIKVEKYHDGVYPDIQLLSEPTLNNKKLQVIYIEIFVTHKSEEKKIAKGERIIEIKIRNESDIFKLRNSEVSPKDSGVNFFNFQKKKVIIDYCSHRDKGCRHFCESFFLYKNGCYEFVSGALENILSQAATEESRIEKVDYQANTSTEEEKHNYIRHLIDTKTKVKDCRFCKYVADKVKKNKKVGHFCKFLKKDVVFDTAFDCKFYRLKEL